ncbi:MAG: Xaa-Pro peptidase family protein [Magnetococcus sp. DMHC-6]
MTSRLIIADSERCADQYYATALFVPDPFLFLRLDSGESHILISALEVDRARRLARVNQVWQLEEVAARLKAIQPNAVDYAELVAFFLRERGVTSVEVPQDFPLGLADELRRLQIQVMALQGAFWPQRAIKSAEEITAIGAALTMTSQAMATGISLIKNSQIGGDGMLYMDDKVLTSEWVRGEINATLVRLGAVGIHTIVAGGDQAADPHEAGHGPLFAHRPIILDIFPRVEQSGYWGDMTRTVCRGSPSPRAQQAYQALVEAQKVAFATIREGVSGLTVHEAVQAYLTRVGFETKVLNDGRQAGFFHGTGHGLGLEVHELPRLGKKGEILRCGHVVTVEPGLYYPDLGGLRLEDVVVVEAEGCRILSDFPKVFCL